MASLGIRPLVQRLNAHPRARDAVAAVLYLLLGLALLQWGGYQLWDAATLLPRFATGTASLLLLIAMAALAALRSTRPFLVLMVSTPLVAADLLAGGSVGVMILFGDFVYCAFRFGTDRGVRILLVSIIAACVVIGAALLLLPDAGLRFATIALQWALILLIAALWGWSVRSERQRTRSAMAEEHLRATQRMRQRIAGDLHDLVANQIAVAGLNVEAARMRIPHAVSGFDEIDESLARATTGTEEAHSELRRLIALLSTVDDVSDASDRLPQALDLDGLLPIGRMLVRQGADLDHALDAMPTRSAGITMRAVQELVANAVKHGAGDIVLTVSEADTTTVRVSNAVGAAPLRTPGTGIGITGAALLLDGIGGTIASESAADDGLWIAALTVPRVSHA